MSEETNNNQKIAKKSQSPKKLITPIEEQNIPKINMTEQVSNKSKTFLILRNLHRNLMQKKEKK